MINTINVAIWGRVFTLKVRYDLYNGEFVLDGQKIAVESLSKHPEWIENAKAAVEDFCKNAVKNDLGNKHKENIFSYIKPLSIFVKHEVKNTRVAIICAYRYEPDNGLAIVFANNGSVTVGLQDIII